MGGGRAFHDASNRAVAPSVSWRRYEEWQRARGDKRQRGNRAHARAGRQMRLRAARVMRMVYGGAGERATQFGSAPACSMAATTEECPAGTSAVRTVEVVM